jgi:hypothetical protein
VIDALSCRHPLAIPGPLSLVEDQNVVVWQAPARPGLQIEVMPAADEDRAPEGVLKYLDERVVARVENRRSVLPCAVLIHELESDQRLARSWDAGHQDQVAFSTFLSLGREFMERGE